MKINYWDFYMHCISYSKFGPSDKVLKLEEIPNPVPSIDEVLIKIRFSGVNPSDAKSRAGVRPGILKPEFEKIIPNSDGSGTIIEVGENINKSRIGERVWIWNAQWKRAYGTAAEFVCLPSKQAIKMPDKMPFEIGACLGIPGLTAAQCVLEDETLDGKAVLISGGAGSVGNIAVQLAKWSGAEVIATGSPENFDYIKKAGADHILDYNDPDLSTKILTIAPTGVDKMIEVEFGVNIDLAHQITKPNGTVSIFGSAKNMRPSIPFGNYLFKALTLRLVLIYILPYQKRLTAINYLHDAFEAQALNPSIDMIYNLSECSKAHDHSLESGRKGAILLQLFN